MLRESIRDALEGVGGDNAVLQKLFHNNTCRKLDPCLGGLLLHVGVEPRGGNSLGIWLLCRLLPPRVRGSGVGPRGGIKARDGIKARGRGVHLLAYKILGLLGLGDELGLLGLLLWVGGDWIRGSFLLLGIGNWKRGGLLGHGHGVHHNAALDKSGLGWEKGGG